MTKIGSKWTGSGRKAMLLGSGELGKEVAIELQRLGIEVVACDKYANAPAMHVADSSRVFNMLDADALRAAIEEEKPDNIIPEVEAIATPVLVELEKSGYHVTPTAKAALLTMNREGIRRLAAEELGVMTSPYRFASDYEEFKAAVAEIGIPCVVKPIMSSSGHGQSVIKKPEDIETSWKIAQEGGRAGAGRVIVEGFVKFDYEITLLTVRSVAGTSFCEPIGHIQVDGDYRYSWQPQPMSAEAKAKAQEIARKVTDALGGLRHLRRGTLHQGRRRDLQRSFSPPPRHRHGDHDFAGPQRICPPRPCAFGLPVPEIRFYGPSASRAVVVEGDTKEVVMDNLEKVLEEPGVQMRIFGKPEVKGHRRMAVILATADSVEDARAKADRAYDKLKVEVR